MTTANPQQPPFTLFLKFSTEIRPSDLLRRDDRIPMTCSFEEIAESEEEDMQLSERTSSDARSPFAVSFESPFAERRGTYPRDLSPTYAKNPPFHVQVADFWIVVNKHQLRLDLLARNSTVLGMIFLPFRQSLKVPHYKLTT
ncbi:unnamed protein product [Cylicocyclus nassatus]|uniref:Uncharacterized protein n=1 Tax=Cylicocyclus nassatus TaxID=53992 RepID=A0AA36HDD1_CYLNA|nr:unnamed protein product [Cylicocyclus nassatus]